MLNSFLSPRWVHRGHHIPKIRPVGKLVLGQLPGHVRGYLGVSQHLLVEVLDAQLLVLGDCDEVDVFHFEQLLTAGKDVLTEVLVDHRVRGHVQLLCGKSFKSEGHLQD